MLKYKGFVSRQELVEFCQKSNRPKMIDSGELQTSIEQFEALEGDYTATIHSLNEAIMENTGYQRAMRDVTEWAKRDWEARRGHRTGDINPKIDENNRFKDAEDPIAVLHQMIGAASMCWVGGTGDSVFDSEQAISVAVQAVKRLREMGVEGL